ncbi:MAG: restriction endonuclease [Clostridia bacterium]|nr:restriction endonuclease [Clostridia bacterium]
MTNRKKIYKLVLNALAKRDMTREKLLSSVTEQLLGACTGGTCPVGKVSEARGATGAVITEMLDTGVVISEGEILALASSKPIALRAESCEKEIISLLSEKAMSKREIRDRLVRHFGTDKTSSKHDDNILFTLIGQVLKRLVGFGLIVIEDGDYKIAPEKAARLNDITEYAALKSELMARIHSKGGEFFEHFVLTLLSKHFIKHGKTVTEGYVTGGSSDGGIDGIIKTTDSLGFRENHMIQAKNRLELTSETAVRSFYGAVCAAQGSRGIFATTSDFHPSARSFLEGIDNCIGINADMIFKLACECQYGVKKHGDKYVIDTKIL